MSCLHVLKRRWEWAAVYLFKRIVFFAKLSPGVQNKIQNHRKVSEREVWKGPWVVLLKIASFLPKPSYTEFV